jgi:outer membrane protein TolC
LDASSVPDHATLTLAKALRLTARHDRRIQAALSRVRIAEAASGQARLLAQAEAQYKAGQTDITSLFLAEQDLRAARARTIELERRASEALIRLERSAGGPGAVNEAFGRAPTTAPATTEGGF